jgi:hypothetical protein
VPTAMALVSEAVRRNTKDTVMSARENASLTTDTSTVVSVSCARASTRFTRELVENAEPVEAVVTSKLKVSYFV